MQSQNIPGPDQPQPLPGVPDHQGRGQGSEAFAGPPGYGPPQGYAPPQAYAAPQGYAGPSGYAQPPGMPGTQAGGYPQPGYGAHAVGYGHPNQGRHGWAPPGYGFAPPKPSSTGVLFAVFSIAAGGLVFLYLGMLGGRAAGEVVLALLGATLVCAIVAAISVVRDFREKRAGRAIGIILAAAFGVILAVGSLVLDEMYRKSQSTYGALPSPSNVVGELNLRCS
jgi:predicted outer membrane lipoprotein